MTFVFVSIICLYGLFRLPIIIYINKDKYILSVGCENFDDLEKAVNKAKKEGCYCKKTHDVLKAILTTLTI